MNKLRLGIIGNGYLGGIIAGAWRDGLLPEYELVGIVGRTKEKTDALAKEVCCSSCSGIDELL